MKIIIILACLIAVHAGTIPEECNGVTIGGVYHDKEIIHECPVPCTSLAIDYSTNDLYFITLNASIEDLDTWSKSARLNLNTREFKVIEGVHGPYFQTVDQENHVVYIGGNDGIYKYNPSTNSAHIFGAKGNHIRYLYYKDVLYYTVYPSKFLYTLINGESTRFADLGETRVLYFVIDNNDVMFFFKEIALYSQKKGTKDATLIKELSAVAISALVADKNGKIYLCLDDGVYVVKKDHVGIEKVVATKDIYNFVFDKDNNMVYSDGNKIIRLLPNTSKNC